MDSFKDNYNLDYVIDRIVNFFELLSPNKFIEYIEKNDMDSTTSESINRYFNDFIKKRAPYMAALQKKPVIS